MIIKAIIKRILFLNTKVLQGAESINNKIIPIIMQKIKKVNNLIQTHYKQKIQIYSDLIIKTAKNTINYAINNKRITLIYCLILFSIWKATRYTISFISNIKIQQQINDKYDTEIVNKISVQKKINCYGFVESDNNLLYQSQTSGIIKNFYVKEKQQIKTGDLIVTIESKETIERYLSAKNFYESVLAKLNATKQLHNNGLESDISLKTSQAEFDNASSNYILAKKAYEGMNIKSPFDGVIENIRKKAGSMINIGEPLFSIQKSNALVAKCNTSDKDILKANVNDDVRLFLDSRHHSNGKISIISNTIEAYSGTRNITISNIESLDTNETMQTGQPVIIEIKVDNDNVFKIESNLVETNNLGGFMVKTYNPKNQTVVCKDVQIFTEDEGSFYVTGLEDGDIVFKRGHEDIGCGQVNINILKNV